jgi:hypothetical protein
MNYIIEFKNIFTNTELDSFLKLREEEDVPDLVVQRNNLKAKWVDKFHYIESRCLKLINEYNSQFYNLMPVSGLSLNHIGFLHDDFGSFTELHYDWEMIDIQNDLIIKPLIVLVYLTSPQEGGELIFPLQNITIKPEQGKVVIFPCSFMFPHLSTPLLKGKKDLMRLTYRMDNNYYKSRKIEL